jgi:hypothetical protein
LTSEDDSNANLKRKKIYIKISLFATGGKKLNDLQNAFLLINIEMELAIFNFDLFAQMVKNIEIC